MNTTKPLPEDVERVVKFLKDSHLDGDTIYSACLRVITGFQQSLDEAERKLMVIRHRNLVNAVAKICEKCGHTITEDGCAYCITHRCKGMEEVLRALEWDNVLSTTTQQGRGVSVSKTVYCCPLCHNEKEQGHLAGCPMAKALQPTPPTTERAKE